jgi:hypothetical protein
MHVEQKEQHKSYINKYILSFKGRNKWKLHLTVYSDDYTAIIFRFAFLLIIRRANQLLFISHNEVCEFISISAKMKTALTRDMIIKAL